jgi:HdeA/HdeB family
MKKYSLMMLSVIGASALAVFSMTAPAQAKDAGDWTCEDFLKVSKSAQSSVVYYLVGLNKAQMKEFHDISAKDFNVPVSKVIQHCRTNRADNLWEAIANHFYWHAMKMP